MEEAWIGMAAVVGPTILIGLFFWFRYKSRSDLQQTIRLALDKGNELSPELIDRLGHPAPAKKAPAKNKDLRLGIMWLAVALAFAIFGQAIPAEEANAILLGIAAFPLFIGLAYLLIARFASSD